MGVPNRQAKVIKAVVLARILGKLPNAQAQMWLHGFDSPAKLRIGNAIVMISA
jgi:hypothetical protein